MCVVTNLRGPESQMLTLALRSLFSFATLVAFPEDVQLFLLSLPSSLSVSTPSLPLCFLRPPLRIPRPFPFVGSGLW